jgi:hypothetical protein
MSGSVNPLVPPVANTAPTVPIVPPTVSNPINQALASRVMRGKSQEHVLRRRDAVGGEMEMLAKIVNNPNPDPKEVQNYVVKLLRKEHIQPQVAGQILASMPRDPAALRNWARMMFSAVMHEGIHAHAAFPRELDAGNTANQPPPGP